MSSNQADFDRILDAIGRFAESVNAYAEILVENFERVLGEMNRAMAMDLSQVISMLRPWVGDIDWDAYLHQLENEALFSCYMTIDHEYQRAVAELWKVSP